MHVHIQLFASSNNGQNMHLGISKIYIVQCGSLLATMIKLEFSSSGQHIAALEYLVPEEYTTTLKVLHANAPQSTLSSVRKVIKEEFGKELEEIFEEFDEEPLGCASLAQVR